MKIIIANFNLQLFAFQCTPLENGNIIANGQVSVIDT